MIIHSDTSASGLDISTQKFPTHENGPDLLSDLFLQVLVHRFTEVTLLDLQHSDVRGDAFRPKDRLAVLASLKSYGIKKSPDVVNSIPMHRKDINNSADTF